MFIPKFMPQGKSKTTQADKTGESWAECLVLTEFPGF